MKSLQNCFTLGSKLTIYVPSTVNTNHATNNAKHVKNTASLLSALFGGATSTQALGYWMSSTAGLVKEKTTMVFAYCQEADLEQKLDQVISHCENMKKEMSQEAIALELNGTMYFL